jgi:hypothetical protein
VLTTDYLIIGSGAVGMTFADEILTETDAELVIVDRHHMPGGHWNDSYPFVRLHQPSAFYGAGSRALGSNRIDSAGFNSGYHELASGAEVSSYFDGLMRERFLPSGRVKYFPMSDYVGDGRFVCRLSGRSQQVSVRKKIVGGTFFKTAVPSTHTPNFGVAAGVTLITPNVLPQEAPHYSGFTIVGGGKTAMDVGVWLLQNGVDPDRIHWIVPRDFWLIDRDTTQPGDAFAKSFALGQAAQMEAAAAADSVDDYFERMEAAGAMLRIDRCIRPSAYRCATISRGEVGMLRKIRNVVRKGHVRRIERGSIVLQDGVVAAEANALYIDCTATAVTKRPPVPVFDGNLITIQTVRPCRVSMSAATIAHVETHYSNEVEKNDLCRPLPVPNEPIDALRLNLADLRIQRRWAADRGLRDWLAAHRLSGTVMRSHSGNPDPELESIQRRIKDGRARAEENLARLLGEAEANEQIAPQLNHAVLSRG